MIEFWYASYIFLGLALAIGIGIYAIYRELRRRQQERRAKSPLQELEEKYLKKRRAEEGED